MDRRTFLLAAVAGGALTGGVLTGAPRAFAAPTFEGQAKRLSADGVRLDWTAQAKPVSIYLSNDANAPRQAMRKLQASAVDGAEVAAAVAPRPYFLLETADGQTTRVAERLLPLAGGRNFRDLGGYYAADGRQVRWGKIYRSGVMSGLTDADFDYLSALGVKVVCDLRSPGERQAEPSPFLKNGKAQVVTFDYDMSMSMAKLAGATTRAQAVDVFASAYIDFLQTLTPHYTDMFARLAAGEGPLAMNCSAGKDRTGMGSALVLSVLGVPRETVVADYALTQVYTPPSMYRQQMAQPGGVPGAGGMTAQQMQAFARTPPEVLEVIMGSDSAVMRQALAAVDAQFGGPVALAKSRFGLTDAKIARMRSLYLA